MPGRIKRLRSESFSHSRARSASAVSTRRICVEFPLGGLGTRFGTIRTRAGFRHSFGTRIGPRTARQGSLVHGVDTRIRGRCRTRDAILVEQMVGTDEIDCLAKISGELVLFELKDKEFNLGSAYSFGAKIGIIKPRYPVIVTSEHVGNDAKEHFIRAGVSGVSRTGVYIDRVDERDEISYVEGVEKAGIEELVSRIYKADGIACLMLFSEQRAA
jgi:hypothetical protein